MTKVKGKLKKKMKEKKKKLKGRNIDAASVIDLGMEEFVAWGTGITSIKYKPTGKLVYFVSLLFHCKTQLILLCPSYV